MNVSKAGGSYVTKKDDADINKKKDGNGDDEIIAIAEVVCDADAAEATPVSELFSTAQDFIIKNDEWFGGGDAEILVPVEGEKEDKVMYRMVCFDTEYDVVGEFKECKVVLKNLQGDSVLIITNYLIAGAVAMELLSPLDIHEKDYQKQLATAIPLCRVHRKFGKFTIHNRFEIEMLEQASMQNHYENIDCVGQWPKKINFLARASRQELASGSRNLKNDWTLHVEAGEDVLLFIGIACAIDRITNEFKMNHII
mmetsp:Transcript_9437/g.10758  ORF Transcript_9437/g.10758 Transcript_9437/m.10758 type:complete len:254 (+) Transcript_9437:67-828(+)